MAVKLVVAQNINGGFDWKVGLRPLATPAAKINVSGQHHNIGIGGRDADRPKFQVQITENVQTHR